MDSIWSKKWPRIPADNKELPRQTEVAIIGGGMAGLLCAYLLKEIGVSALVLEEERVCSGQTKNTTAKITSQHGLIYDELAKNFGDEVSSKYGRLNERAIDEFERIIKMKKIECGFQRLPSYLYTKTEEGEKQLELECEAAKKAGIRASLVEETELSICINRALKFENQAQFHPLEFLNGIVEDLHVLEKTKVLEIKGHDVVTERGRVRAGAVVLATHFPFVNFPGLYFARMHQERSYVVALKHAGSAASADLSGVYYGIDPGGVSIRSAGDVVLVGGKSERTGVRQVEDPYQALREAARHLFPEGEEVAHWAAQDCMTLDKLPYIGRFSKTRPYWYVATGFEKWGMTNSMIAAMAIRDMITGKDNLDWKCVSPQRKLTGKAMQTLVKEIFMTTKNFVSVQKPRCPHLGCRLIWNPYEHTWDCPCHGSRFAEDGQLIDNPAQKNLNER